MRNTIILLFFLLQCNIFAQHAHSEHEESVLTDSAGIRYALDSKKVYLVAIDKNNKMLWYADPYKDNKLKPYKVERPVISEMFFVFSQTDINKEVIWILYDNTQYGEVDKKTGKFLFLGQE